MPIQVAKREPFAVDQGECMDQAAAIELETKRCPDSLPECHPSHTP